MIILKEVIILENIFKTYFKKNLKYFFYFLGKSLLSQLCDSIRAQENSTYKVLVLAVIVAHCEVEQNQFVLEIINVCFLDETTREHYYKV